jgi:hypothetical protein
VPTLRTELELVDAVVVDAARLVPDLEDHDDRSAAFASRLLDPLASVATGPAGRRLPRIDSRLKGARRQR